MNSEIGIRSSELPPPPTVQATWGAITTYRRGLMYKIYKNHTLRIFNGLCKVELIFHNMKLILNNVVLCYMALNKWKIIVLIFVCFLTIGSLFGEESEIEALSDDVEVDYTTEEILDNQTEIDSTNEIVADDIFEEQELETVSRVRASRVREINFTRDDIIRFIEEDKAGMVYTENLYEVPYQDRLKINNAWLINTQIPIETYTRKLTNFGQLNENRFTQEFYPYMVTLTRLYAGLGDFDKNFAHLTMQKDDFATIPNLNFRGDFRGRDEYKMGLNRKESDFYFQIGVRSSEFGIRSSELGLAPPMKNEEGGEGGEEFDDEDDNNAEIRMQNAEISMQNAEINHESSAQSEIASGRDSSEEPRNDGSVSEIALGGDSILPNHNTYEIDNVGGQIELQTPNSALQTPNSELRTPHSELRTPNSELRTPNSELQTPNSKLQTPNSKLQTPNSELRTPNSELRTPHSALNFMYLDTNRDLYAYEYYFEDIFVLNNEVISENWQYISLDFDWKYLFSSVFHTSNRIDSSRSTDKVKYDSSGAVLGLQMNNVLGETRLSYQITNDKLEIINTATTTQITEQINAFPTEISNSADLSHTINRDRLFSDFYLLLFDDFTKIATRQNMSVDIHRNFSLLTDLRYSDVNRPQINYRYENHILRDLKAGLRWRMENGEIQVTNYKLQDTPSLPTTTSTEASSDTTLGWQNGNPIPSRLRFQLSADFLLGQKKIRQYTTQITNSPPTFLMDNGQWLMDNYPLSIIHYPLSEEFFSFSSEIRAAVSIYDFVFLLNNRFDYDHITEQFYLIPNFTNTLDLSLTWLMRHDNKMSIGTRLNFIDSVLVEGDYVIRSNPVVDAYFSLGITKLFDIKLELNNIYRNAYFGNEYLNDFHISSYLVWYFIN